MTRLRGLLVSTDFHSSSHCNWKLWRGCCLTNRTPGHGGSFLRVSQSLSGKVSQSSLSLDLIYHSKMGQADTQMCIVLFWKNVREIVARMLLPKSENEGVREVAQQLRVSTVLTEHRVQFAAPKTPIPWWLQHQGIQRSSSLHGTPAHVGVRTNTHTHTYMDIIFWARHWSSFTLFLYYSGGRGR